MLDLRAEVDGDRDELVAALAGVVDSSRFVLGPQVAAFEAEVAGWLGAAHAVGVNSGTDALAIALRSFGVGPGHEVVTTAFTFVATAEAIATIGAVPVFADIDPATFNLDADDVARRLTPSTRAVVPVHLYGAAAPMGAIADAVAGREIVVVEDAAQAFGAAVDGRRVGTIGHAAAFSFFPSKPLGGFGDGGMLVTDDPDVAATARLLRSHGAVDKHHSTVVGYNSRLDEIQASVLRVRLRGVDDRAAGRRRAARRYTEALSGVGGVVPPPDQPEGACHLYTVRVLGGRRAEVAAALDRAGIDSQVRYPVPLHRVPAYRRPDLVLPHADQAAEEVLSLPLWPTIPDDVVDRVATVIADTLS